MEILMGMVGMVIVVVTFIVGFASGAATMGIKTKQQQKKWIDQNCCYLCKEKQEYEDSDTPDFN
jgi:hypothetical protein